MALRRSGQLLAREPLRSRNSPLHRICLGSSASHQSLASISSRQMVRKLPGESAHPSGIPVGVERVRWLTALGSRVVVSGGIQDTSTRWNIRGGNSLDVQIIEKACVGHVTLIKHLKEPQDMQWTSPCRAQAADHHQSLR